MSKYNQKEFAKIAGVSRQAIVKAIKEGRLVKGEDRKIDRDHPLTISYEKEQLKKTRKELKRDKERAEIENHEKQSIAKQLKKVEAGEKKVSPEKKRQQPKPPQPPENKESDETYDPTDNDDFLSNNSEYLKNEKIKTETRLKKIDISVKLEELVPRVMVQEMFGKISANILNFFFPIGGRLAPIICGICEIDNPEIKLKIKNAIDDEVTRGLRGIKKACKTLK
jgi:hypothetical protein